jgi:hypothetical protein
MRLSVLEVYGRVELVEVSNIVDILWGAVPIITHNHKMVVVELDISL